MFILFVFSPKEAVKDDEGNALETQDIFIASSVSHGFSGCVVVICPGLGNVFVVYILCIGNTAPIVFYKMISGEDPCD